MISFLQSLLFSKNKSLSIATVATTWFHIYRLFWTIEGSLVPVIFIHKLQGPQQLIEWSSLGATSEHLQLSLFHGRFTDIIRAIYG